jgi:hypothetical protein
VTITSSTVTMLNPDGSTLAGPTTIGTTGGGLEPTSTLPTTGTYTIVVDPSGVNTGSITLKLMSYLSGTLNLNGAATVASITPIGRNALYTFTGTAGQWVSLGMTAVTITSSTVTFWKPDGTQLTSISVGTTGGSLDPPVLPTTGTYTVTVNPSTNATGNITLTLSTEITGAVTINAAATPVALSRAGQNARFTFAGTASQPVTVKITGNTLGSVTVNLYTPSGAWQAGTTQSTAIFNPQLTATLGTTGTYTITINPTTTATGSLNLQVTSP